MVNIFRFASHIVSVATQLCHCNVKDAMGKTEVKSRAVFQQNFFFAKEDLIWPVDDSLPTSGIE